AGHRDDRSHDVQVARAPRTQSANQSAPSLPTRAPKRTFLGMRSDWGAAGLIGALLAIATPAVAAEAGSEANGGEGGESEEPQAGDLAKAVQNPVADLISVPLQ